MKFAERFEHTALAVSGNPFVAAIRKGLLLIMPLVLIGSFSLMLLNLPIPAVQNALNALFGEHWRNVALTIYNGTFQIMALTALVSISYTMAGNHSAIRLGEISPIYAVLIAFASYVAFCWDDATVISTENANSTSMFGAIVIAILSTSLFLALYKMQKLRIKLYAYDADALLMSSLRILVPALLTISAFGLFRIVMDAAGVTGALDALYLQMCVRMTESGSGLVTAILFMLMSHIMWFFGLHGTNILDGAAKDIFVVASESNIAMAEAGMAPQHIVTKEFLDNFVYLGGCGCTLGLLIALLLVGRRSNINRIGYYSLMPALFNINEMMVYGLPIIFNPYYLIPFLLTPTLLTFTTYSAMRLGLVPLTMARVEWTTPIFISGYASTGSWAGVLLQLFNLTVAALIYVPFIRVYEKSLETGNKAVFEDLGKTIQYVDEVKKPTVMSRPDEMGVLARALAAELDEALAPGAEVLHLQYQPKVDMYGKVVGAEALLRWNHPVYGFVPPPIVVQLCEEAGMGSRLGGWVLDKACRDLGALHRLGYNSLCFSVNISPHQLEEDAQLVDLVEQGLAQGGLDARHLELELTENAAIDQSDSTVQKLEKIKEMGVSIAIDDFGMGHSSLLYLRDFSANVLKLDKSLVDAITTDMHSQGIVGSVALLCSQLGVGLIAEGVETQEQKQMLVELGCYHYQGYLFSRPLPLDQFIAYVEQTGCSEPEIAEANS